MLGLGRGGRSYQSLLADKFRLLPSCEIYEINDRQDYSMFDLS